MRAGTSAGPLHHLELWVEDLAVAEQEWDWLLTRLGFASESRWPCGRSWRQAWVYVVLEAGPDVVPGRHDRRRQGVNHLVFWAGGRAAVDAIAAQAPSYGWTLLFGDRHPHAGGPEHYAAYLESTGGFEVEVVAGSPAPDEDAAADDGEDLAAVVALESSC
ncbi:MAG: glyoxalase [Actinomycetota bacterium]|nr:glyoxalase [Actinomycetota bacterium]